MKKFLIVLCFLWSGFFLPPRIAEASVPLEGLVLYAPPLKDYAVALTNLLGHFEEYLFRMEPLNGDQKVLVPEVRKASQVFVLGDMGFASPEGALGEALLEREKGTCFVGNHEWLGASPILREATYVWYKGRKYWMDDHIFHPLQENMETETYASLEADGITYPFIFRQGGRFFVLGLPFFENGGLVLADALHDILGISHETRRTAMIRLEDLNPSYRAKRLEKLRESIAYLHDEGIPFAMAVYPVFRMGKGQRALRIIDTPEFLQTIQQAEAWGGTVIFHGTSHQYRETSGEGSEFWDIHSNRPIPDEKNYFHEHMRYGLWLFEQAGLHPKLFEAPHYNLPLSLQEELPAYFGTIAGSLMINNQTYETTQDIPYLIHRSVTGLRVLPEQLGYIQYDDRVQSLLSIQKKLDVLDAIVRDPFACFFYHPYVDGARYLQKLVPFLLDRGYSFADVGTYGGPPRVSPEPVEDLWPLVRKHHSSGGVFWIVGAGFAAALLFGIIYGVQTRRRKKGMFRSS